MRLAFISTMAGSAWGGSEELWAAAARAALAGGHSVLISTFDWPTLPPQIVSLRAAGARVVLRPRKPSRLQRLIGLMGGVVPMEPSWLRTIRGFSPHGVLVSQGSAYECVARSATRPLLRWLANSTRPVRFVNLVQFNRPGVKRNQRTQRDARRFYQSAAANLFVCRRNITEAAEWLGAAVPQAKVVCNPANLGDSGALPWPADNTESKSIIRLACVARLDIAVKGQDLLLRALAEINEPRVHVTFAGVGTDGDTLRELARRLGLQDRVDFAGQVADIRGLWASHHMLVLASHSEGTPLAMIEAMLLGRPVVVTDVGGCGDWVTYGREGWIAASSTVSHIVAALRAALEEQQRWESIGAAARERATKLLDPQPGQTVLDLMTLCCGPKK